MAEREKLIELKDLQITFGSGKKKFVAVDHVNFDIYKGETFSLVGESGSGKTTIGRAICRINPTSGGDIFFKGQKINGKIPKELDREVIRKVQMIFQDPMASLNKRAKVEYIVAEGLLNHHLYKDQDDLHEKVMNALHEVGLLPEFASRFPHEFSGGQRQRIGIARALVMEPEFIVADEPISALDVSIRAQVLNLLRRLQKDDCLEVYDQAYAGRNRRYYKLTEKGQAQLNLYKIEWKNYSTKIGSMFEDVGRNADSGHMREEN